MSRVSLQLVAGVLIAGLGLVIMLGWLLQSPIQVQGVAMVFNTALCLALLGLAFLVAESRSAWRQILPTLLGWTVLALASAVFLEFLLDVELGVDWRSLHEQLHDQSPRPGRMAPNTALGLMLAGFALILMRRVTRRWQGTLVQTATLLVTILGLTGLVGYALQLELLYPNFNAARMALHTAIGMVFVGIGLWSNWHRATWYASNQFYTDDKKIAFAGTALLVVVAVTTGTAGFAAQQSALESALGKSLPESLNHRVIIIHSEMERAIAKANNIAQQSRLVRLAHELSARPGDTALTDELGAVGRDVLAAGVSGVAFLDGEKRQLLRMGKISSQPALVAAIDGSIPAYLLWDDGIHLRSFAPIVRGRTRVGTLVLEERLPAVAEQLMKGDDLGATGYAAMCVAQSSTHHLCYPNRQTPYTYRASASSKNGESTPMNLAVRGDSGVFKGLDFRNRNVIAAHAPLTSTGVGIAVKQDSEEVLRPIRAQLQWSFPLLLLIVAVGAMVLRAQLQPLAAKLLRSELRVRTVVESVGDGIITIDEKGTITSFNSAASAIFGYTAEEVLGSNIRVLMPAELRDAHDKGLKRYLAGGEAHVVGKKGVELSGLRKDGSVFPIELSISAMVFDGTQTFVGIVRDITERLQAEATLFGEKERLRVTLGSIGDGVITTDVEGRVTYLNAVAESMTGWISEQAVGKPLPTVFHIVHEHSGRLALNPAEVVLRDHRPAGLAEHTILLHLDGRRIPIEDSAAPIHDINGQLIGVVLVFHDVSQARLMAAEISFQAKHDALTGLINRREFEQRLEMAIESGRLDGKSHAILFLDLDAFKAVNDTGGHAAGDELLRQLTPLMQDELRQSDTLARLGGDEFAALLENCSLGPALRIAESLLETVRNFHFLWAGKRFSVGVSVGLATFGSGGLSMADVLRMADTACYMAKGAGKNRVHVFEVGDAAPAGKVNS